METVDLTGEPLGSADPDADVIDLGKQVVEK